MRGFRKAGVCALAAGAVAGFLATAPAVPAQAAVIPHPMPPACTRLLAAYELVADQAQVTYGWTTDMWAVTGPRTWAGELRAAGDVPLADTALGISVNGSFAATSRDFVEALRASIIAAANGNGCRW